MAAKQKEKPKVYIFAWGNNPKRKTMKGRRCVKISKTSRMRTCLIRFLDNGQEEFVSERALRLEK